MEIIRRFAGAVFWARTCPNEVTYQQRPVVAATVVVMTMPKASDAPEGRDSEPEHAWKALALVNEWVRHAEAKAGTTLAAAGVVGAVLYNLMKDQANNPWYLNASSVICGGSLLLAGVLSVVALWPRLSGREEPTSSLYFNHIARKHPRPATYQETLQLLTTDPQELTHEVAHQVWANARVAHRKYFWAAWGVVALAVALGSLAVTAGVVGWNGR